MFTVIIVIAVFQLSNCYQSRMRRQQDGLENFILNSFSNFGDFLATGAYDLRLPSVDPIEVKRQFSFQTTTKPTKLSGNIRRITLTGLSNMSITDIDMNLPDMKLNITFTISKLMITGEYFTRGVIYHVFPIHGNGDFVIEAENVTAKTRTDLKLNPNDTNLEIDKFEIEFKSNYMLQQFDQLLGGGHIGTLLNHIGRKLSENVFESLHPFLTRSFGEAVRRKLIQVLRTIRIPQDTGNVINVKRSMQEMDDAGSKEKFNDYFDQVIANVKKILQDRNITALPLPEFDSKLIQNGSISGLSSLQRYSDAVISLKDNHIFINVGLELRNIKIVYYWMFMFIPNHQGIIEIEMDSIKINLKLKVDLMSRDIGFQETKLTIMDMDGLVFTLKGFGPFNFLVSDTIKDLTKLFKRSFAYLLETSTKFIFEFSLNIFLKNNLQDK